LPIVDRCLADDVCCAQRKVDDVLGKETTESGIGERFVDQILRKCRTDEGNRAERADTD
jgi:hypothetical protein